MSLTVKAVTSVEMIRDGGSLSAKFLDANGAEWILFLPIDQVRHENTVETLGFKEPVLIDTDPAKRPASTATRIYSALSGPATPLTWEEAQTLVGQIVDQAPKLSKWAAEWLEQLRVAINSRGGIPPDMPRSRPIQKKPRT